MAVSFLASHSPGLEWLEPDDAKICILMTKVWIALTTETEIVGGSSDVEQWHWDGWGQVMQLHWIMDLLWKDWLDWQTTTFQSSINSFDDNNRSQKRDQCFFVIPYAGKWTRIMDYIMLSEDSEEGIKVSTILHHKYANIHHQPKERSYVAYIFA